MKTNVVIESDLNKLHGVLVTPKTFLKCGIVFLHGGGHANTTRYEYLQNRLESIGVATLAFDMRGCGQSEGQFADSSLNNRERDADNAIKFFCSQTNLCNNQLYLWGSSMGAHVACKLCNKLSARGLVLQSPAAYGESAESLLLGEEFTKEINKPNSWKDSPAFEELSKFSGKTLVVFGKNDTVIPDEVKRLFRESIKQDDKFIMLDGGIHTLLRPQTDEEQKALEQLGDIAINFVC